MKLQGNLESLGIGSMPFANIDFGLGQVFENYKKIPYWPQLPNLNNFENMYIQYCEGLPACEINIEKASVYMALNKLSNSEREEFYNNVIQENVDAFEISEKFSIGIYALKKALAKGEIQYDILKGHVTGPVSFGLTVTDENKKSLIYNDEARDMIIELIAMKAAWQEKFFEQDMIIFFDEPYMVSYGSAFFNMPEDIIIDMFNRCFDKVKGFSGIHCCGNTDWSLVLKTNVDIINFDAFLYMDNFLLYAKDIKKFMENNGFLAWGLIPTNERITSVSFSELEKIFNRAISILTKEGVDRELIFSRSFITPSCGTGSMNDRDALKVFEINKNFSNYLKEKYCLE
jgi:hypothetical protein